MKRNLKITGIVLLVLSLSFVFMAGCAKKEIVKEETLVTQEEKAPEAQVAEKEALSKEQEDAQKALEERERLLQEAAAFEDVYFDFDKYDLKTEARETLKRHADWLLNNTEFEVILEGHCDERGTREYNLALGERRSESVRDYILNLGIDAGRLTTISYGEELPLDPSHTEEAWAKNRRVHFVVVTEKK
ncbi:MAG: peptidoglycan-associated lipoprotein Pal [Deltaproteobacteria bacterium]|nr:peptidoglycan-associated lipoprotein Pal [Deltaproteobacteria bacterium]